ncbi:MAG TPA: hypothetical protein VIJ79_13755 [Acidobacteriaceae bacterium]
MDHCWQSYDAWIAYFDLLGFKAMLRTLPISILRQKVDEIVKDLHAEAKEFEKNVECLFYADTFVFYSKTEANKDYPGLLHVATHFMEKCIYKGIALRGAISFGEIAAGNDKRILIGSAFLDSHQYGEDQDWLGLILTPTASNRLKEAKLDPARHRFVYGEIPRKGDTKSNEEVYAYSFCRGVSDFPCPLLHKLKEMQLLSPEDTKHKYENTIRFIEKHWRMVQS